MNCMRCGAGGVADRETVIKIYSMGCDVEGLLCISCMNQWIMYSESIWRGRCTEQAAREAVIRNREANKETVPFEDYLNHIQKRDAMATEQRVAAVKWLTENDDDR